VPVLALAAYSRPIPTQCDACGHVHPNDTCQRCGNPPDDSRPTPEDFETGVPPLRVAPPTPPFALLKQAKDFGWVYVSATNWVHCPSCGMAADLRSRYWPFRCPRSC
jgi:hypothetical protein